MKNHYGSREFRSRGRIVKGSLPALGLIQQRKTTEIDFDPETHARCQQCQRVIRLRSDGTLKGHRSRDTIPCIGATTRVCGVDY